MSNRKKIFFDWVDALKAFAIIGILMNHLVEEFSPGPWFTNPSNDWADFSIRMKNLLPPVENIALKFVYFLGWLGDSGPGVFILLSGFGLTMSALLNENAQLSLRSFYLKRLRRIFPL